MNDVSARLRRVAPLTLVFMASMGLLGLLGSVGGSRGPESAAAEPAGKRFDTDEAEYLAMGVHSLAQLLGETDATADGQLPVTGQPGTDPWRAGVHESTFGFQSPGLPKVVFGLVGRASGVTAIDPAVYPRFVPKELPKGAAKERRLAARERLLPALGPARDLMRVLASLVAVLLFAAGRRVAATWGAGSCYEHLAGSLAAGLWLASPATLEAANHVRPGLLVILFWTTGLALVQRRLGVLGSSPRLGAGDSPEAGSAAEQLEASASNWSLALVLGLALGLATASKLNGVLFAPLVPIFLALVGLRGRRLVVPTAVAGLLAFAVFVLFAPGLWHDTLGGTGQMLQAWRGDLAHQAALYGDTVTVPKSYLAALVLALGGLFTEAGAFSTWMPHLGASLGLLGIVALAGGARHSLQDRAVLAWCVVLVVGSGLVLPMDRLRYLLPLAAPAALAGGLFVARGVLWARARRAD